MSPKRILYITQEIYPYLPETPVSCTSRYLPQAIQEKGREIRTFMPKYGNINERRNQLHEVIRLSGMNLIIDDTDHSLIIKVASLQPARMQVYFIDNEDFFENRINDANGVEYDDNDERSIFFIRGVIETIKKLRWIPNVVHCHGWITALVPFYLKKGYFDDPCFKNTKVVYSVYDNALEAPFHENFAEKLRFDAIGDEEIADVKKRGVMDFENLTKLAIDFSDGVIQSAESISPEIARYIGEKGVESLPYYPDFAEMVEKTNAFYDKIDA
ncbi:MAG: glycogen/starch synthase [Dysgonamonadaceae bacterium]|jgi:starch synthase|nr:glycogen/starch synthase [Dysgonamonadaceae bacterium]